MRGTLAVRFRGRVLQVNSTRLDVHVALVAVELASNHQPDVCLHRIWKFDRVQLRVGVWKLMAAPLDAPGLVCSCLFDSGLSSIGHLENEAAILCCPTNLGRDGRDGTGGGSSGRGRHHPGQHAWPTAERVRGSTRPVFFPAIKCTRARRGGCLGRGKDQGANKAAGLRATDVEQIAMLARMRMPLFLPAKPRS